MQTPPPKPPPKPSLKKLIESAPLEGVDLTRPKDHPLDVKL
jgi:hypothetical protein